MTEHAAVIFVFFFLAEYGSILLMCILISIFFLGGYLINDTYIYLFDILSIIWSYLFDVDWISQYENFKVEYLYKNSIFNSLLSSLILGLKTSSMVFTFIWVRASFPRIRFDQLMTFCWTVMLPILFAYIILIPCILFEFNAFLININVV
jgi:NADH-ubiquinone oxidoreductase chain 1